MNVSKLTPIQYVSRSIGVGFVATQVLDVVSAILYENLNEETRLQEDRVRGGHQAYEVLVERIAQRFGRNLDEDQIKYWGWRFHRTFGAVGGFKYMALRQMFPKTRWGLGLGFGVAFFVLVDEFLIYALRLTPGPTKFSWKTHLRGAIAHIAYGVAAELTARSYERLEPYENAIGFGRAEDRVREPIMSESFTATSFA